VEAGGEGEVAELASRRDLDDGLVVDAEALSDAPRDGTAQLLLQFLEHGPRILPGAAEFQKRALRAGENGAQGAGFLVGHGD
jgi:hypothetical protein